MTPDLRATSERRELALADALAERESANKHFKLTSKYKKVRFFGASTIELFFTY